MPIAFAISSIPRYGDRFATVTDSDLSENGRLPLMILWLPPFFVAYTSSVTSPLTSPPEDSPAIPSAMTVNVTTSPVLLFKK